MTDVANEKAFNPRNNTFASFSTAMEMVRARRKQQQQQRAQTQQLRKQRYLDDMYGYADQLSRAGRLHEALALYQHCVEYCAQQGIQPPSAERLRHFAGALLEDLVPSMAEAAEAAHERSNQQQNNRLWASLACPSCETALYHPVTLDCGHTYCKPCLRLEDSGNDQQNRRRRRKPRCKLCIESRRTTASAYGVVGAGAVFDDDDYDYVDDHDVSSSSNSNNGCNEINVLVQRLAEKWWPREVEASQARHEGDALLNKGHIQQAFERYDLAVQLAPNSPVCLCSRAHALLLLNRPQAALDDTDRALRLRPDWGKGKYERGLALSALRRYDEALVVLGASAVLDKNPYRARNEFARVLHRVILDNAIERQRARAAKHLQRVKSVFGRDRSLYDPYRRSSLHLQPHRIGIDPLNHHRHRHHRDIDASLNDQTSDCEDNNSGGEDDFQQQNDYRRPLVTQTQPKPQDNMKLCSMVDRLSHETEKLKRLESSPSEILLPPPNGGSAGGDLDCILCCRLLWMPVTTPCGHTYCWTCLDRCLDYSSACPLCMTSLADYLANSQKSVTDFVEKALLCVAPQEYAARSAAQRQELVQPLPPALTQVGEQVAVFVCTTAFPCTACPLFVYEPRYRLMVRRCLESGVRQFGIAACLQQRPDGYLDLGARRYAEFGTMLEIKDRVLLKDGCSILSTVGMKRFRVLRGGERDGYDTAEVEFISDVPISQEQMHSVTELHKRVRAKSSRWWATVPYCQRSEIRPVFGEFPDVEADWQRLPDGPSWTWWLLAILPLGPQLQIGILATTSLEKRLRAIEKTIDHMEQRWNLPSDLEDSDGDAAKQQENNSQDDQDDGSGVCRGNHCMIRRSRHVDGHQR
ncbi:LON peptidase N-terminal domain and RING finger protein 3 [Trichogramma pretiosum]|uniref:LON peptidase N-terminal domain and RING finger protein 3 n=1 Tax=Trichogramma pretiosum TaxID=7493 RepID=UPI0006C94C6F|nr:LON peptidase N-terminal domain and RING finger protein 3 [Trichogramma pretiosum]